MDQIKEDVKRIRSYLRKFGKIHDFGDCFGHLTMVYTKFCKKGERTTFFRFFDQRVMDYLKSQNKRYEKEDFSPLMYNCATQSVPVDEQLEMKELVDRLDEREKKVIYGIFYEGKSSSDLASEMKLSKSRISHIKQKALNNLKKELEDG